VVGLYIILTLAVTGVLFMVLFIYGTIKGFTAKARTILSMESLQEIVPKLRELIEPNCGLIPTLEATAALDDDEYLSFFHHVYIPYREQVGGHAKRSISKDLKKVLWIPGFMFAGIAILLIGLGDSSGTRKVWLSILALAVGVGATWLFYYLDRRLKRSQSKQNRFVASEIELLHMIDDKLLKLNGEVEPPPSKISLGEALQDFDKFLSSFHGRF
jgi:hypothetical protein